MAKHEFTQKYETTDLEKLSMPELFGIANEGAVAYNALDDDTLGAGFVEVKCPNCGGTSRIRAETYGKCSYCGESLFGTVQNADK